MKPITCILFYLLTMSAALAHGPDGDHAHGDAPTTPVRSDGRPRVETFTETYELVGELREQEFAFLIDRYETNEPVLDGKVEVELGGLKAIAGFRADHGDYAVDDQRLLKVLRQSGNHALVFTVAAGEESDLLEATLRVGERADGSAPSGDFLSAALWFAAGMLTVAALAGIAFGRIRRGLTMRRSR
ncbi:MAG TPA: hypothetical protein VEC06_10720 [Paucimonas sp.]|nr:hypothetical protein [Paucimonas sp.]